MSDLIPVEGHKHFFRDSENGAIVNNNTTEFETYLSLKKTKEREMEKSEGFEKDLAGLKSEINEIKSLLKELVNGS